MSHRAAATPVSNYESTDLAAFSALLRSKSLNWSQQARALKYELECKPVEQERRRVASEVHDEVLPLLARLARSVSHSGSSAQMLVRAVHGVVDKIRDLLGELHPLDLDELGLTAAISNLCARYTRAYRVRIIYKDDGDEMVLAAMQQVAIYRALQILLRMFARNDSGTLTVICESSRTDYKIRLFLRDCEHSVVRSLIGALTEPDLDEFAGWCNIAQIQVLLVASSTPHSVVISIPRQAEEKLQAEKFFPAGVGDHNQARLVELETVVTAAQQEWVQMLNREATVTGNMTVSIERQRLCRMVDELIYPDLEKLGQLAHLACDEKLAQGAHMSSSVDSSRSDMIVRIDGIRAALDSVITAVYPSELQSLTLLEMISLSVEKFKRATLINTNIVAGNVETMQDLALEKKIAIYRIVQEALHNVEKHAAASTLLVLVELTAQFVLVYVEDNGLGIAEHNNVHARGMRGVKQRAQEIGATVSWQKSISYDSGTLVTIKLPLP